jgi:hypothetical protein
VRVYIAHMFYYYIWLKSSRGTNERSLRCYPKKPSQAQLKENCEQWCASFGAWSASENVCSYGWTQVRNLPKNRREALARFTRAHKAYEKAKTRMVDTRLLLLAPPFNGSNMPKLNTPDLPVKRKKSSYQVALGVKKELIAKSYRHVKVGRKKPHPMLACRPGSHEITFFADPAAAQKDLKR